MCFVCGSAFAMPTIGPELPIAPAPSGTPSVATDGEGFLIVFTARPGNNTTPSETIEAVRVDASGKVLDAAPIVILSEMLQVQQTASANPVAAYDPGSKTYLVAWSDGRNASDLNNVSDDIYAARLSQDGRVLDANGFPLAMLPGPQTAESVTFGAGEFLVTFQSFDNITSANDIRGNRVQPNGQPMDGVTGFGICTAPLFQGESTSAFDGTNFFVTWLDRRNGSSVFGTLVGPDASVKSPNGFAIEDNNTVIDAPFVAFGGGEYFAVWGEKRAMDFDIYGARLKPDGSGLDGAPLQIVAAPGDQGHPSIRYDGSNFFVAWDDSRNMKSPFLDGPDVYGSWVDASGTVQSAGGIELAHSSGINYLHNRSAFNATGQGLLTFQHTLAMTPFTPSVGAELVANGGSGVNPAGGSDGGASSDNGGGMKGGGSCAIAAHAPNATPFALLLVLLLIPALSRRVRKLF